MLDLLSLIKNRAFWVLMLILASAVGTGYYVLTDSARQLQQRNAELAVALADCQQRAQAADAQYTLNVATYETAIANQAAKIAEWRAAADGQQQRVAEATRQLSKLRAEREQLIKRLRDTPVDKLGCEASIGLLVQSAPSLGWKVVEKSP